LERMSAAAAASLSEAGFSWVNAGSGALRVVPVAAPGPPVGAFAALVGVLAGEVAVVVGCVTSGALEAVTVFVPEPQPSSSTAPHRTLTGERALDRALLIARMVFAARCRPPRLA